MYIKYIICVQRTKFVSISKVHDLYLGEVHDFLSVGMDADGPGHSSRCSVDGIAWQVWTFTTVVLLLNQMVPANVIITIMFENNFRDYLDNTN